MVNLFVHSFRYAGCILFALLAHARWSVLAFGPYNLAEGSGLCFVHAVSSASFKPFLHTHCKEPSSISLYKQWLP